DHILASAPLLPKFVSERAATYYELRKRGTGMFKSWSIFHKLAKDNGFANADDIASLRRPHRPDAARRTHACGVALRCGVRFRADRHQPGGRTERAAPGRAGAACRDQRSV